MENKPPMQELKEEGITVALTHDSLTADSAMNAVRSPKAGATVLFAGTTRDNFNNKLVKQLEYTSYPPLALQTMLSIARHIKTKHSLTAICLIHRLGVVPIGEESIMIAVSAPHRHSAWRGGEEALEECKEKVEVWKLEEFEGGEGVWRANRDGAGVERVGDERGVDEG